LLRIEGVDAGYKKLQILFGINAVFKEKDITILVGPNGSGKSTLLKTIMGLTQLYKGKIVFDGTEIGELPPHEVTKLGMAYLPQVNNVFSELRVKENLLMAGYTLDREEARNRSKEVLEDFPVLKSYLDRKAGTLSGGERQMLAMAMALIRRPKMMLFDEPTGSLAPKKAIEVISEIVRLRDTYGITVLLAEQNARRALEHGDKAILLVSGRVMYDDEAQKLLKHPELGKVYLGMKKV
jgi:branched-chain amino acid transport system ATP-binding protein